MSCADEGDHLRRRRRWRGDVGRPVDADARPSPATRPLRSAAAISAGSRPSRWARSMILSSMSVTFDTSRTSSAAPLEVAAEDVVDDRGPAVAEVGRPVDGRAAQVDAHLAGLALGELADLTGGGVVAGASPDRSVVDGRFAGRRTDRATFVRIGRSRLSAKSVVANPASPTATPPERNRPPCERLLLLVGGWPPSSASGRCLGRRPGHGRGHRRGQDRLAHARPRRSPTSPSTSTSNGKLALAGVTFTTVSPPCNRPAGHVRVDIKAAGAPAKRPSALVRRPRRQGRRRASRSSPT